MNQDQRLHYGTDVIPPWRESLLLSFQHYVCHVRCESCDSVGAR